MADGNCLVSSREFPLAGSNPVSGSTLPNAFRKLTGPRNWVKFMKDIFDFLFSAYVISTILALGVTHYRLHLEPERVGHMTIKNALLIVFLLFCPVVNTVYVLLGSFFLKDS